MNGDKNEPLYPLTFFRLGEYEVPKISKIKTLIGELRGLPKKNRERKTRIKSEIKKIFRDIIRPHLNENGLECRKCYVYENLGEIVVNTPLYESPNKNNFGPLLGLEYRFVLVDEALKCSSAMQQHFELKLGDNFAFILNDALKRATRKYKLDGEATPILDFALDSLYFAPTSFATPLMQYIWEVSNRIGVGGFVDLDILYKELLRYKDGRGFAREKKVFREAYESKLEKVLADAKLV